MSLDSFPLRVKITWMGVKISAHAGASCGRIYCYMGPSERVEVTEKHTGLPRSGKKVWKMKIFPGQGKVREFQF